MTKEKKTIAIRVFKFYSQGFKKMGTWGRQVWLIILIKLFIMFVILRIFFFPNYLQSNFENDDERSQHVLEELTEIK